MRNILYSILHQDNYSYMNSNVEEIGVYYRYYDNVLQAVLIIDLNGKNIFYPEQIRGIENKIHSIFRTKGYGNIYVFKLVISNDISNAKRLMELERNYWIIDSINNRIVVYENEPSDFYGLYGSIDKVLEEKRKTDKYVSEHSPNLDGIYQDYENPYPASAGPYRDIKSRNRPPFRSAINLLMIFINVAVFIWMEMIGSTENTEQMIRYGAAVPVFIIEYHEYWRLFTCMFLHFGITHLLNNMLVLLALGDHLERLVGKVKYLIIYLVGGLGGSVLSLLYAHMNQRLTVSAGASGAVFAVIGALLYIVIINKGRVKGLTGRGLVLLIALTLYHGFTSTGIDNFAHIGGLFAGFILAMALYRRKKV